MIVISAALVVVAIVLLVIGLVDPNLTFVYASIGVSLGALAFLVVGILQRRGEELPGGESATGDLVESVTTLPAASAVPAARPSGDGAVRTVTSDGLSGEVLVVEGRPRYHAAGCRYLTGKDAGAVDVTKARADGYTACGVCKPDETLAPAAAVADAIVPAQALDDETDEPAVRLTKAPAAEKATPAKASARSAAKAVPAKPSTAKTPVKAPVKTPVKTTAKAPAKTTAAKAAPVKAAPVKAAPVKAAAPAKPAAAKAAPAKRGGVIVIPDRGKFHTATCRYVRGAEDTVELTRAAATKQGYEACGVCNP